MPVYERAGRLIHFVHVPKAGGTSIRTALECEGWRRWDLEIDHQKRNPHGAYDEWSKWYCHLDIDFEFAVIRHPETRMKSLINHWLRWQFRNRFSPFVEQLGNLATPEGIIFLHEAGVQRIPTTDDEWKSFVKCNINLDRETLENIFEVPSSEVRNVRVQAKHGSLELQRRWYTYFLSSVFSKEYSGITWTELVFKYFEMWLDGKGQIKRDKNFAGEYFGPRPIPFSDHLGPTTKVFKLESGLEKLEAELKRLDYLSSNSTIKKLNRSEVQFESSIDTSADWVKLGHLMKHLYSKDYEFYTRDN
jgi:hypothetical protein